MVENRAVEGSRACEQAKTYRRGTFSTPMQLVNLTVTDDVSTWYIPVVGSGNIRTKERQTLSLKKLQI